MTTAGRALPRRVSGVVERLELDQPRVVTMPELARLAVETGACDREADAPRLAYWLEDLGWLGSIRTRGAWEFIPGARAGAFGSGDRFIEFRAQLAVRPGWPGVLAMESAATVLGLAQRLPEREVVALPAGLPLPKAMSDWRVVSSALPEQGSAITDGLPHWNVDGLVAGIAARPSGYRDLAGLAQWLPDAGDRLDAVALEACLDGLPQSAYQRAAYLCRVSGAETIADELLAGHPPANPVWFGATRQAGAAYDPMAKVSDADLTPYLAGGVGA